MGLELIHDAADRGHIPAMLVSVTIFKEMKKYNIMASYVWGLGRLGHKEALDSLKDEKFRKDLNAALPYFELIYDKGKFLK